MTKSWETITFNFFTKSAKHTLVHTLHGYMLRKPHRFYQYKLSVIFYISDFGLRKLNVRNCHKDITKLRTWQRFRHNVGESVQDARLWRCI